MTTCHHQVGFILVIQEEFDVSKSNIKADSVNEYKQNECMMNKAQRTLIKNKTERKKTKNGALLP